MITLRPAAERGHGEHGWLSTWHSFSFSDYHDPAHMRWSVLRVINEDTIAAGAGFGNHGHRDMEIVTYVLTGSLQHRDSMGHIQTIRRPEVQRMSAGRGVMHGEANGSDKEAVHLLQIWIEPNETGIPPEYEQRPFPDEQKRGHWQTLVSPDGRGGSMRIHQDAVLAARLLAAGEAAEWAIAPGRRAYVHLVRGEATLNGLALKGGDGAKITEEKRLSLAATAEAEVLLFDLP